MLRLVLRRRIVSLPNCAKTGRASSCAITAERLTGTNAGAKRRNVLKPPTGKALIADVGKDRARRATCASGQSVSRVPADTRISTIKIAAVPRDTLRTARADAPFAARDKTATVPRIMYPTAKGRACAASAPTIAAKAERFAKTPELLTPFARIWFAKRERI